MTEHWANHHQGPVKPVLHQYIIGRYKSSLERQVVEAVIIQLRGNLLNSVAFFNRSKLTLLVVDQEWKWKEQTPLRKK